jgi:hypothetical protein
MDAPLPRSSTTPAVGIIRLLVLAVITLALAACGGANTTSATKSSAAHPLHYVAFGDSWPEGAHCGGCITFAGLWARDFEKETGREVEFQDFTGAAEHSNAESKGSGSLLNALRSDRETRARVRQADVILIATGPNDMDGAYDALAAGSCGGTDHLRCVRDLGKTWHTNFDAILTEIRSLLGKRPAAIRLVNAANPFLSVPEMNLGMTPGFATAGGALIFKLLTDAVCDAAQAHQAVCIDVRPILNGPSLNHVVDENSAKSMQAVAASLRASGLSELD